MTKFENKPLFDNAIDEDNLIWDTDSYKYSHARMFPADNRINSATITARKPWGDIDEVVFFGLQFELAKLQETKLTHAMIDQAEPFLKAHGFDIEIKGWRKIVDVYDGRLPIRIDALPEGTVVAPGVPQVRIENTDDDLDWLPSFLETRLLRAVWYPSTVASLSRSLINTIKAEMIETDGNDEGAMFKLHDFGARGASSKETAARGGAAHLVSSMGTDTVAGLIAARNIYGADMAGYSVNATEHSVMTANGEEGELDIMSRLLDAYPTGILSVVSDSYDLMRAVRLYWGDILKDKVLARDGVLVVRPDSGKPEEIVPEVIEALMECFGETKTAKGYRILPDKVRVIQGDGINKQTLPRIIKAMKDKNLAVGNIVFGMGGGLLQAVTRDDFGYAMKTNARLGAQGWVDVFKDPKTANGTKTSPKGRQAVVMGENGLIGVRDDERAGREDMLKTVFENGFIIDVQNFDDIRARAARGIVKEQRKAQAA